MLDSFGRNPSGSLLLTNSVWQAHAGNYYNMHSHHLIYLHFYLAMRLWRAALRRYCLTLMVCFVLAVKSAAMPHAPLRSSVPIVYHLEEPPNYARRKPAKRHHLQSRRTRRLID